MVLKTDGTRLLGALVFSALSAGVAAQTRTLTADDYAKAERFMSYRTAPLVDHAVQSVTWLDDGRFWYRDHDAKGDHYLRMDAATGKAEPASMTPRATTTCAWTPPPARPSPPP